VRKGNLILGLDLATITGWCKGRPDEIPRFGSIRFGKVDASPNAVFGAALQFFSEFLQDEPPDFIMLEKMLPPMARKGATNRGTRDRLAGLHGILRGVAFLRGCYDIAEVSVLDVRQHFCGARNVHKERVFDQCRMLGWAVQDNDAADACATWSFACGLVQPETALAVTPLFGKRPYRVTAGAGS
jgi:hypothetical protein